MNEGTLTKAQKKFEWFYNLIKGRKDVKSRVAVLANPDNPQSMSILTKSQAEFVQDAFWLESQEKCYRPLKDYAEQLLVTAPSIKGQRVEQVIRFVGAMNEPKILSKLGIPTEGKESKK